MYRGIFDPPPVRSSPSSSCSSKANFFRSPCSGSPVSRSSAGARPSYRDSRRFFSLFPAIGTRDRTTIMAGTISGRSKWMGTHKETGKDDGRGCAVIIALAFPSVFSPFPPTFLTLLSLPFSSRSSRTGGTLLDQQRGHAAIARAACILDRSRVVPPPRLSPFPRVPSAFEVHGNEPNGNHLAMKRKKKGRKKGRREEWVGPGRKRDGDYNPEYIYTRIRTA